MEMYISETNKFLFLIQKTVIVTMKHKLILFLSVFIFITPSIFSKHKCRQTKYYSLSLCPNKWERKCGDYYSYWRIENDLENQQSALRYRLSDHFKEYPIFGMNFDYYADQIIDAFFCCWKGYRACGTFRRYRERIYHAIFDYDDRYERVDLRKLWRHMAQKC